MSPYYGPDFDLAVRLRQIEDQLSRMMQNPLGQAFSTTQSDGSVGIQFTQDPDTGSSAMIFRQGSTTPRDPHTDQHPTLLYIGEVYNPQTNTWDDSWAVFFREDSTTSLIVSNTGARVLDPAGNIILAADELGASPSKVGLDSPWIPLGQPVSSSPTGTGWPNTTSTSLASVAYLTFPAQHSRITWYGITYCPTGTTGEVQVAVNNGAAGATHSVGAGYVNVNETFQLGTWSWQEALTLEVNAAVTSGPGPIYFAVQGVWGCGSGS